MLEAVSCFLNRLSLLISNIVGSLISNIRSLVKFHLIYKCYCVLECLLKLNLDLEHIESVNVKRVSQNDN